MNMNEDEVYQGFVTGWKPICAICQYTSEVEQEHSFVDDDGCDCRQIKKRQKDKYGRFLCNHDSHLRIDYITGEKSPVPCSDWNRHGACREFSAIVPEPPSISVENNVVTISLAIGSEDGTRIFYTTDGSDPHGSDTTQEYISPFDIDSDVTVNALAVLANSESVVVTADCKYLSH